MENAIKIEKFSIAWDTKNSRIKQRDRDNKIYENRSDFKLIVAKILFFVLRGKPLYFHEIALESRCFSF